MKLTMSDQIAENEEYRNDGSEERSSSGQTKFGAFVSKYKVIERFKKLSSGSLFSSVPGQQS